mmetsp:Transcript_121200/g.342950  ORF Transcript_121200/g.342950 Transcript_121200/m.342950 type:complete len:82 (+) Transcript_121200:514-759(+)
MARESNVIGTLFPSFILHMKEFGVYCEAHMLDDEIAAGLRALLQQPRAPSQYNDGHTKTIPNPTSYPQLLTTESINFVQAD